jgi:hypothetical protein
MFFFLRLFIYLFIYFQVDKLREIMRSSLDSDSPQNCINAVDHYLPCLYGMVKSQEKLPPEAAKFIRKQKFLFCNS